jgi:hypothetical protein
VGLLDNDVNEMWRRFHHNAYLHLSLRLGMNGSIPVLPLHDRDVYRDSITLYFLLAILLTCCIHIVGVEDYCCA